MKESIKTRVRIKEPWQPEFIGHFETLDGEYLRFNMVNVDTGEIRQKTVTLDYIARHLFKNMETERKNHQIHIVVDIQKWEMDK